MRKKLERWHKVVAGVAGAVSLRLQRTSLNRGEMERWAAHLESVAIEMREEACGEHQETEVRRDSRAH